MKIQSSPYVIPGVIKSDNAMIMDRIVTLTSNEFGINKHSLFKRTRKREIVDARRVSMLLIKQICHKLTLLQIARYFGGDDHSRVIRSIKGINDLMDTEPELKIKVNRIQEII